MFSASMGHPAWPDALACGHRHVGSGQALFRQGDRLDALFEVSAGQFKTVLADAGGRSQVTGFQGTGAWLGLDGIGTDRHCFDAVALEDSQVHSIPFAVFNDALQVFAALQHAFHRRISRELARDQGRMFLLGKMRAEARLATFILEQQLSRQETLDLSPLLPLRLSMSREDIGSYLGMALETVSRMFTKLHACGVLDIHHRTVRVLDLAALRGIARSAA